jgi:catechol 2,3-dioxygenase-like lactoylglutathione lyase family enzyme
MVQMALLCQRASIDARSRFYSAITCFYGERLMLDHIGIAISDHARARVFYDNALAPLGIALVMAVTAEETGTHPAAGYGSGGKPYFWIGGGDVARAHIAFAAQTRAAVDAFYQAAIAAGGKDNGSPGPRPEYHENYYGDFVLDPDGHNIEAVRHTPV